MYETMPDHNLPEELIQFRDNIRRFVDRELRPLEKARHDRRQAAPGRRSRRGGQGAGRRVLADGRSRRTGRRRPRLAGAGDLLGGDRPHHCRVGPRPCDLRADHRTDPALAAGRHAREVPDAGPARGTEGLLRPDRARRRIGPGIDAHPRGPDGQWLEDHRQQALHHQGGDCRLRASHGRNRPGKGRARRHFLLHRRYGHAGRDA